MISYDLDDIVGKVNEKDLRNFLCINLKKNWGLLYKFRVEFSSYFPKLSREDCKGKIYNIIAECSNSDGYITDKDCLKYERLMNQFIKESQDLIYEGNYEPAFAIASAILDSIPYTVIDDTEEIIDTLIENCLENIYYMLYKISDINSSILKDVLDYLINEIRTQFFCKHGIDLNGILRYFLCIKIYLEDIKEALEYALDNFKDEKYFKWKEYIKYLIEIYKLTGEKDKIIKILEKYSYDSDILEKYVKELNKKGKVDEVIKILKKKLNDDDNYNNEIFARELAKVYLNNNMMDEYKDLLYKIFYKYDKYGLDIYCEIKNLYSKEEWDIEKMKIINDVKKDKFTDRELNEIYIEEKMYDELYLNVCDYDMDYIKDYEKYLLPKYNNELLDIYMKYCLKDAERSNSRSKYRAVANKVMYIMKMDNSSEIVKKILKEIKEKYFINRVAMVDEFRKIIKNLDEYI